LRWEGLVFCAIHGKNTRLSNVTTVIKN
jgi:hypothetical protein